MSRDSIFESQGLSESAFSFSQVHYSTSEVSCALQEADS